jgi:hypothetical protein
MFSPFPVDAIGPARASVAEMDRREKTESVNRMVSGRMDPVGILVVVFKDWEAIGLN